MIAAARRKWFALALLLGVQFMVVLDIAIVNVALPSIQTDLGFTQENLQWVVSAYALLFGGFLLLGGRVADIVGRRRVFVAGLVVFTAASLISGLAWSEASLIAARGLQGLGAALITPAALSILSTTFAEGKERNAALGAWGAVGAFGAVAGVLLGGVLTDALSWEWIFFVNVPVGIAGLALAFPLLNESRDAAVKAFDVPGAVLVTGGLVALVYAITQANDLGWTSIQTVGLFAGAVALLVGFVVWELRTAEPLMSFSIFRIRTVTGANVAGLILGTAMFSMFLMLTLYMQQVLVYSAMKTGVAYLAVAGTAILWSAVAAQLVNRIGVKPVLTVGMSALTLALLYFTQVSPRGVVCGRPAPRLPADRGGARLLVRADLDRGARRRAGVRAGARVRADQHVAADRRRGRDRGADVRCDVDHRRCGLDRNGRAGGVDGRVPGGVPRRCGDRVRRRPRRALPGAARGPRPAGAGGRRGSRARGRVRHLRKGSPLRHRREVSPPLFVAV